MSYAELHCLSNFSFLRGASHPGELVQRARQQGYTALALTDECSMAGIVRAHQAAQDLGLPLIVGSEIRFEDGLKLVFLAENHAGYTALCELITRGRRASEKGRYRLAREDLGAMPDCCVLWVPPLPPGARPRAGEERDTAQAAFLRERFHGRLWIAVELQRQAGDAARLQQLRELGRRFDLPLVAAGDVHMHSRARRAIQDVVTAIRHGLPLDQCGQRLHANGERHLRTLAELQQLYPQDLLDETRRIAQRCRFNLGQLHYEYPHEIVEAGEDTTHGLRRLTEQGLRVRWPQGEPPKVRALIEKELRLIAELKYEPFFLTVYDIVRHARSKGILCQGRGSAANSAVCYALGITEVDPARMNMLFERFISKERNEPPDIDVDFEHQRREEVIQYIYGKYGRERAALAATVICYRPRSALRDAGKALGFSQEQVDRLAKSLAWWDSRELLRERIREQGFDPDAPALRRLLAVLRQLVGFPRHLSQHVGGFVISERALSSLVPVENAAMPERSIIQWDKDDLEHLGLLKVDCLALGMLSAIRRTLDLVGGFRGRPLRLQDIPAEDAATYAMIRQAKTIGVFQIESRAQMSMLPRLQPKTFYDLVIQVAIVRPGPIQGGMVHPYLKRRADPRLVCYPSAALEKVLGRTLGVPLFQEQVIEIANVAAGFTPGEADQLRRSMAAWKRNGGFDHLQARLFQGMAERGYTAEFAAQIFEMIKGFASYGFPESHAASFALLAYVSAWLKCHQPAAFTAGLLNSQPMGFYPPAMLLREAQRSGVELRGVDVMHSGWDCGLEQGRAEGAPALRLGLCLVKGCSEAVARRIENARAAKAFADVADLVHRAKLDTRARKLLADAGALATLAGHRHAARWNIAGIEELPGLLQGHSAPEPPLALRAPREGEDILYDYQSLGLTLQRHPLALLRPRLQRQQVRRAADLEHEQNGRTLRVAGLCMFRQRPETASGVMFVSLEDETGIVNLIVRPRLIEAQRRALLGARLMLVTGRLQREQGVTHVLAQCIEDRSAWLGRLQPMSRDFR